MSLLVVFFVFAEASGVSANPAPQLQQLRQQARRSDTRGDFRIAEELYRREEVLAKTESETDHFVALEDLGNHYWQTGDLPSAVRYFRFGLNEIRQLPKGKTAPVAPAIALDNLGSVLRRMDAFEEAQPIEEEAAIVYASLGMMVDTAHSYAALAEIALGMGNSLRAMAELKTATELLDTVRYSSLAQEHTLVWIAQTYLAMGCDEDARAALNHAEALMNRLRPVATSDEVALDDTKGALLFREQHYADAERMWNQVLDKADPHSTAGEAVRVHLGQLYNDLGRYRDAEPLLRDVILRTHDKPVALGIAKSELGRTLMGEKQQDSAAALFGAAIADLRSSGADKLEALAVTYARYGDLRIQQKRWDDALGLLQHAISITNTVSPQHPALAYWLLDCENVYRKLGNKKAANECRARAQELLAGKEAMRRATVDIRELQAASN